MVDFLEAARRHYEDAEQLFGTGKMPNAGHLFGLQAECAIKALLVAHGLQTLADGDIDKKTGMKFRKHIDSLGPLILGLKLFPDGRTATRYMAMIPKVTNFYDWDISHRYWGQRHLPSASIPLWRLAAVEIGQMLDQARIDGVLA